MSWFDGLRAPSRSRSPSPTAGARQKSPTGGIGVAEGVGGAVLEPRGTDCLRPFVRPPLMEVQMSATLAGEQ